MDLTPSTRQRELIALARRLARERFAPRAARHDREASFPFEDYADLRGAGLLGLCVPARHGGLGADYETYCLVAEQIAQGNASTALTFNMHCLTMLMMGVIADTMPMPAAVRARHETLRAAKFRQVIEEGAFYGQPHSEPVEQGETDTSLSVGGRRFGTTARKVDGGYVVNGRKFFVSLAGCAPYFATPAIRVGDEPWIERTLYLQVPVDAPGVSFPGDWDPMGMRATVSRDMLLQDVFVPDEGEVLPPGMFGAMYNAFPHLSPLTFCATFLGLMQAAYDGALAYLTGRMPDAPGLHTEAAAKGPAVAEMLFALEAARALYYRAVSEARADAPPDAVQRARAAHVTVQRSAVTVTQEAIRVCGGRGLLKRYPLERYARDARAGALMRPWTQEIATQQAWETALRRDGMATGRRINVASGRPLEQLAHYSRAVRVGDLVLQSGTTAIDRQGAVRGVGDVAAQVDAIMAIARWSLGKAGSRLEDVVRHRLYVTDIGVADAAGRAVAAYFRDARPAATLVQVSRLARPDQLIEIELDAVDGARDAARRIGSGRAIEGEYAYSRAVRVGDRVFISGTTALGPGGAVEGPGDLYRQTRSTLATIFGALAEAGGAPGDIVYTKTFLTDLAKAPEYTRAWLEAFGEVRPASTLLGVPALLRPEMLIEVEAEAIIGAARTRRDVYLQEERERSRGYARAVAAGDVVFVSGCTAISLTGRVEAEGDWARQTDLAHEAIERALVQAGASLDDVVRRRTFTVEGAEVNRPHGQGPAPFSRSRPASLGCRISGLARPELLVEVEVTAVRGAHADIASIGPDAVDPLDAPGPG